MALQGIGHFFRHIALFTHSAALLTEVISTAPERQQWVVSGLSPSYQFNDRYRVYTGHSAVALLWPKSERQLFPKADVQIKPNPQI